VQQSGQTVKRNSIVHEIIPPENTGLIKQRWRRDVALNLSHNEGMKNLPLALYRIGYVQQTHQTRAHLYSVNGLSEHKEHQHKHLLDGSTLYSISIGYTV